MSALDRVPVDSVLVERFRGDVESVLGRGVVPADRIALAVSGGPDSMAMLALAAIAFPRQVLVATVDHGLRPEAADEAALVADYATRIGISHDTLQIETPPDLRDNVHAWARERRYHLLARWAVAAGAAWLATAHHADDQAETFLMRAVRGSGVAGLAGIRPRQRREVSTPRGTGALPDVLFVDVIRPLLDWRASDLRALATTLQVPFVDDPSNLDPRYDRTRFRALLHDTPLLDPVQIARSAAHVAQADRTIREIESWLWRSRNVLPEGLANPGLQTWVDIVDLPRELKRRMARTAIHAVRAATGIVRPAFDDSTNIEPLLDALEAGKAATQAGIVVTPKGSVWRFAEQPPRRSL